MLLNTFLSRDLLVDAYKFYSRGDARAKDALSIINQRDEISTAVTNCLEQALKEEEINKQRLYLGGARFGKENHPGIAIEEYLATCKLLRVKNTLRDAGIDQKVEIDDAIEILVSEKKFELAIQVLRYLGREESRICKLWCEYLIGQVRFTDEQIAEKIRKIIKKNSKISYAEIADKAIDRGKNNLAIKLIENEDNSSKQIESSLRLKQHDNALSQALTSCDSNLIYYTIFRLEQSIPSELSFLNKLEKHPLAFNYYCNFLSLTDVPKLIKILSNKKSEDELFWLLIDNRVESAVAFGKKTRRDIIPQQIETSKKLLKFQHTLASSPSKAIQSSWVGLSISDTIINLIASGQTAKAKDAQRRYDVSDRKYKVLEQIAQDSLPKLETRAP